ncbi:MAG: ribonuclease PH [Acidobacteriota bacterium]
MRKDGRNLIDIRKINIQDKYISNQPASLLYEQGQTRVICTATFSDKVPFFAKNEKKGWISAEYAMLPASTGKQRFFRERNGRVDKRNIEIQRFVGRALRNVINLKKIGDYNIFIDSDVLEADGGTRCAAVNGGVLTLIKLLKHLVYENLLYEVPEYELVAAVSVGIKDGEILADIDFAEDSVVDADINIVSSEKGNIIEVMGFAEESPVPKDLFYKAMDIALEKNNEIIKILKEHI